MVKTLADLTPIERRVLAYLDQRGPADRRNMVVDLASPTSRAGRGMQNGSNGAAPLIVGKWCKRLVAAGWVVVKRSRDGHYMAHQITDAGQGAYRRG